MRSSLARRLRCTAMFLVIALPASVARASGGSDDDVFKGHRVADTDVLENMRGGFVGFAGGHQLELSFGINHAVFVNGQLLVTTRLTVPSIHQPANAHVETVTTFLPAIQAAATPPVSGPLPQTGSTTLTQPPAVQAVLTPQVTQTTITTLQTQSGQVNIVQIGPGNTVALSSPLPSGVMNVIQNSLNQTTIKQTTDLSVNVNSLGLLRAMNFSSAIQRALLRSIR